MSVLRAETYAFADAYDFSYFNKKDLEAILERDVYFKMSTDFEILFDVITKRSQTQKKRMMIDLRAVSEAYECHEIFNIAFVREPNYPADLMTELGNCEPLIDLLRTGKANFKVEH